MLVVLALFVAGGCGGDDSNIQQEFVESAAMEGRTHDVYWLGTEFTEGGFKYEGPTIPDGPRPEPEHMRFQYTHARDSGPVQGLSVGLTTMEAWDAESPTLLNSRDGTTQRHVTIGGEQALFVVEPPNDHTQGRVVLVVFRVGTVIFLEAEGPLGNGPLANETALTSIARQLRLYPDSPD